jgi:hypothetical protein
MVKTNVGLVSLAHLIFKPIFSLVFKLKIGSKPMLSQGFLMGEWLAQTGFNGACEVCNQNFLKFVKHCYFTCSKMLHA